MKSLSYSGLFRLLLLVVAFATAGKAAADNRLYVPDITLDSTEPKEVQIMLDNTDEITSVGFQFQCPDGISIVGEPELTDRGTDVGMEPLWSSSTLKWGILNLDELPFTGNEGAIMTLKVKADASLLTENANLELILKNVVLVGVDAATQSWNLGDVKANITIEAGVFKLSAPEATMSVQPGKTYNVKVNLENSADVETFVGAIALPEGITLDRASFKLDSRCSNKSSVRLNDRPDGKIGVVIMNIRTNTIIEGTNDGGFFSFNINVSEGFHAETAEIVISDISIGALGSQSFEPGNVTITLDNNYTEYAAATATVKELRDALAAALAAVATDCPDVKDQFTGAEITANIDALEAAIEAAYENGTLTADYATVMEPVAGIKEAIDALVADAKAAQANFTAKANADAKVAELEKALEDALAAIATDCPDVKDQFTGAEITADIEALKAAVAKAYEDGTLATDYDNVMTPAAAIEAAIAKLTADAKAAQEAYEQATADNDEAKTKADAKVKELEDALADALETIATEYPEVKDQFTGASITESINDLKDAIEAAYADRTLAADYENVVDTPAAAIEAAIEKLLNDAKTAAEIKDEEARQAYNLEKYNADLAAIAALQAKLDQVVTTVGVVYPGFDAAADIAAAQAAIDAAKAAVEAAYAAVAEEGLYNYELDTVSIENLINAISAHGALDKATKQLAVLRAALADALETIATDCPLVKDDFTGADIEAQIDALEETVNAANSIGTLAANYDEIMAPVTNINIAIAKLIEDAKAAQAAEVKRRADNEAAYNADLAAIAALQAKFDEVKAYVAEVYPDYNSADFIAEIQGLIDDAKAAADAEYAAVAEEGTYASTLDAAAIEHKIQGFKDAASGIEDILVEAENGNVMIYTIDGKKVARPVSGQINIFVDKAGNVTKKFVR